MANPSILLSIHALPHQGRNILGESWDGFWEGFCRMLREKGEESPSGDPDLLLLSFAGVRPALLALSDALARAKAGQAWHESMGPVPVQIVLDLGGDGEPAEEGSQGPGASLWDGLLPETIHVSGALKLQWQALTAGTPLPAQELREADQGFFVLSLAEPLKTGGPAPGLFPHRALPLAGEHPPCFYCGMRRHKPALCPSKMLTMASRGLPLAGYLPLSLLPSLFAGAMADQEKLNPVLAAGLTSSQVRQSPELQVYLSYFDLNLIFQLRFLWQIAFSSSAGWEELRKPETAAAESQTLHMAFDCLRVGQYAQAEELFVEEGRRPKGRGLCAAVGRAFVSLELERDSDMGHFLENALTLASTEKEKIYVLFLLCRYHWLRNDPWKTGHSLNQIFSLRRDLADALYLQLQLMAQQGSGETDLNRLLHLVDEERERFLAALLDPQLAAAAGPIEEVLLAHHQARRQEAEEYLDKARKVCADLRTWFAPEEEGSLSFLGDLEGLEKQLARGSHFDNLDVSRKARLLLPACYRLQEGKIDEMREQVAALRATWETYYFFWKTYPYPSVFREFGEKVEQAGKELAEMEKKAGQNMHGVLYRSIQEDMARIRADFAELLKPLSVRMGWVRILFDGGRLFARRLLVTELVLLSLALILVPILAFWLAGTGAAGFLSLLQEGRVQKQALLILTLLIAPILALGQTLWRMTDSG